MSSLGEKIKKLRKIKKVTQRQTANAINVTERNYQAYEADTQKPSFDSLLALSKFFDVPSDYLIGAGLYGQLEEYPNLKQILCEQLEKAYGSFLYGQFHLPPLGEMDEIPFVTIASALVNNVSIYQDDNGVVYSITLNSLPNSDEDLS